MTFHVQQHVALEGSPCPGPNGGRRLSTAAAPELPRALALPEGADCKSAGAREPCPLRRHVTLAKHSSSPDCARAVPCA